MTRRIKRITRCKRERCSAYLYACMGLLFLPFFALAGLVGAFAQHSQHQQAQATGGPLAVILGAMMFGFGIFMPVFYGVFGFVFGVISAAIYNLIAHWIGGIEVEVE